MEMGSRRTMARSLSGNGRLQNGTEISGSSRSPGCSYLSNVRPETRSTLCSVIAQLTEETQPFFEVTLKSKAVSESCNVKFSCVVTGYPTPQVTWYKDDIQLDRYCGLPKYEILRSGQNHSLNIYNCTVEDAAIYQASATNTKGIVSCSGVLEVGEMNEFKIHQRYFSKLKQKAENKRREAEEKENKEPARTISPDRAQRKRRSTVGGYISAPCSTEEDIKERCQQEATAEVKARVQESNVVENEDSKGTMESMEPCSNSGQEAKERSSTPGTHKQDSAQKVFTALQPKTFFKKFKISNPKVGPEEKILSADSLPQSQMKAESSMEVESSTTTTSLLPPFKSLKRRVANIGDRMAIGSVTQNGSLSNNSSPVIPPRSSKHQQSQSKIKEDMNTTPKARDRDKKTKSLPPDMTSQTDTSCDSSTALLQPPCQQARHDPPQKETRPAQKEGCVSERGQQREATQAHAKVQRNEALVDLELQAKRHSTVAPEKTPAARTEPDRRGLSLHPRMHKAIDKMTQDTHDHSRGSVSEICLGSLLDTQKPPFEGPSAGENKPECNVSPAAQQSQLNTPIKTVEGTEIQLDEKVKCNEISTLIAQSTSVSVALKGEGEMKIAQKNSGDLFTNHDDLVTDSNREEEFKSSEKNVEKSSVGNDTVPITNKAEPDSKDLQKSPSPIPTILSIAELLRSQINALEESFSSRIAPKDNKENQSGIIESDSNSAKKTNLDMPTDKGPPQTIKQTLMQIYNELIKTKELFGDEAPALSNCAPSPKSSEISPLDNALPEKTLLCTDINTHTPKDSLSEPTLPLKVNGQKALKNAPVQNNDIEAKNKQTPEIKLNSDLIEDNEMITEPFICDGKSQELKLNISSLEPEQVLPVQSGLDKENNSLNHSPAKEDSVIADAMPNAIFESSPSLKKRDCVSIPSATPQELASGARRKIPSHKTKLDEPETATPNNDLNLPAATVSSSPKLSRHSALLLPSTEQASPKRKRSPLLSRRKSPVEMPNQQTQEPLDTKSEENSAEKTKNDPYKAPQVIRKIRGETFSDHSGNMKLWCQFFNVLSESTVTWHRDELAIVNMLKSAGDETQVNLALAQATSHDTGVYGCTIINEYGTDSTDFLLSAEVLAGLSLREDLGVGEEIELTPLLFNKGVADSCVWGNKLFGRIMVQESRLGVGPSHKTWRAKVIYGLEPVFESGNTCILKVCNPIVYGGKGESQLIEKNQEVAKQACKIQNLAREYCKIFSAEARATESFGFSLEVIPVYLMYRPANSIPYATVETDLLGEYRKHCGLDPTGRLDIRSASEVEQKCCALQHWIFQWTSGNMLFTKLEGVDSKITNVGISVKSTGHQGLSLDGNPKVFEQFVIQHQCNYFCGLLGLRSLKVIESLLMPTKPKGSRSPLIQRKMGSGSSSPQTGRKTPVSPRTSRKMEQDCEKLPHSPNTEV